MEYIYTAMFTSDDSGKKVYARVPDLPGCITTGRDLSDAIEMITDAASLWLVCAEDNGDAIPPAADQREYPHDPNATYSLIRIDTIAYRAETDTRAVRKNVSLPAWMATLADKRGINCSQVLQDALKEKLSVA